MESWEADFDYHVAHTNWRVGRKRKRNIYAMRFSRPSDKDDFIGMMETPELASKVVCGHNIRLVKENARLAFEGPPEIIDDLKGLRVGPGGIRVGEEVRVVVTDKPRGVLEGPVPSPFGLTYLKLGTGLSLKRRGVLDV